MYYLSPYKNSEVFDRYIKGLIKAGYKGNPSNYYKIIEENKLNGQEIKKILFGKTSTGYVFGMKALEWVTHISKDGEMEFSFRGRTYAGKAWIEGGNICLLREQYLGGLKSCEGIYRNPEGDKLTKTEYFRVTDYGFFLFSVEK